MDGDEKRWEERLTQAAKTKTRSAVGTASGGLRPVIMENKAARFRDRARDCLNIAKGVRQEADRIMLEELAFELEKEADLIDQEEASEAKQTGQHPPVQIDRQD